MLGFKCLFWRLIWFAVVKSREISQCQNDDCQRALSKYVSISAASAHLFCSGFIATSTSASFPVPTDLARCDASSLKIRSACSCFMATETSSTPTTMSLVATVTITETVTFSPSPTASPITPRVLIISLFTAEAIVWKIPLSLNQEIHVPGFSPLFPNAVCNLYSTICQVTTGEGEINAASTVSALIQSRRFDLARTYFLVAGIAGINPECGTLGSVNFAKYLVQVGLSYEIDTRELPSNYTSGYIPFGASSPEEYPSVLYGTEVFELNSALRAQAFNLAQSQSLLDTTEAREYRARFPFAPANRPPQVIRGDTTTSDAYFHGKLLGEAFAQYTSLLTNSSGRYCMTAQEDNAIMEAMLRGALTKLVDFSRIISMRTASNFDRPPPGITAAQQLFHMKQGGLAVSLQNLLVVGKPIVDDIVTNWDGVYEAGIPATNYIGDVLGSIKNQRFVADIGSQFFQEA